MKKSLLEKLEDFVPSKNEKKFYYRDGDGAEIIKIIGIMKDRGYTYKEIAEFLNKEGCRSAWGKVFNHNMVEYLWATYFGCRG